MTSYFYYVLFTILGISFGFLVGECASAQNLGGLTIIFLMFAFISLYLILWRMYDMLEALQ